MQINRDPNPVATKPEPQVARGFMAAASAGEPTGAREMARPDASKLAVFEENPRPLPLRDRWESDRDLMRRVEAAHPDLKVAAVWDNTPLVDKMRSLQDRHATIIAACIEEDLKRRPGIEVTGELKGGRLTGGRFHTDEFEFAGLEIHVSNSAYSEAERTTWQIHMDGDKNAEMFTLYATPKVAEGEVNGEHTLDIGGDYDTPAVMADQVVVFAETLPKLQQEFWDDQM